MKRHVTRRRVAITIAILLLLLWWFWPSSALSEIRQMQEQLFSEAGRAMPAEERRVAFEQMRAAMAKLTPDQRAKLAADRQQRMEKRMADYAAMSPEDKKHYLDQQIQQGQQFQQQQAANGTGPPGGPGGGNPANSMTPEQREQRRQNRLDNSSPQFRANMDQFRRDMAQRRQELGLPPSTGRGGR